MKVLKKIAVCLLTVTLILGMAGGRASAEDYTYKVRIFPGNAGTASAGDYIFSENIALGTRISIEMASSSEIKLGDQSITLNDGEKYYIRGVRVSGEDALAPLSFVVTQDMDFVVSYGMTSNLVEYTVRFLDAETGEELTDAITYYGSLGDKPVASYQYIEGYQPDYYNITGTLTDGENVWDFHYTKVAEEETSSEEEPTSESETETAETTEEQPTGETETTATEPTTGESTTAETTTQGGGEQPTTTTAEGGEDTTTTAPEGEDATTTAPEGEGETTTEEAAPTTEGEAESSGEDATTAPEGETTAEGGEESSSTEPSEIVDIDDMTIPEADIGGDSSGRPDPRICQPFASGADRHYCRRHRGPGRPDPADPSGDPQKKEESVNHERGVPFGAAPLFLFRLLRRLFIIMHWDEKKTQFLPPRHLRASHS